MHVVTAPLSLRRVLLLLALVATCAGPALRSTPARAQPTLPAPLDLAVVAVGWAVDGQDVLVAFLVENPNPDFAALGPRFRAAVFDATDAVVASQDFALAAPLLLPGERRGVAVVNPPLRLPRADVAVTRVEVQVRVPPTWMPTGALPLLRVEDARYTPRVGSARTGTAAGSVINPFDRELDEVSVSALAFDQDGRIVGGGRAMVPVLPAAGTAAASVPLTVFGPVAHVAMYAAYPGEEPPRLDFTAFAGPWVRHGFGLTVAGDGQAQASWRVYRWCHLENVAPCDAIDEERGIINGGQATIVFRRIEWPVAFGDVLDTTQPEMLAPGPVSLILLPYGMARLSQGSRQVVLCGPDYAELAPEEVRRLFPCGA
jgi:hypothetical protein